MAGKNGRFRLKNAQKPHKNSHFADEIGHFYGSKRAEENCKGPPFADFLPKSRVILQKRTGNKRKYGKIIKKDKFRK